MIGKVFGKLTVKSLYGKGPRGVSWLCQCECGSEIKKSTYQLTKDVTLSCGCTVKDWSYLIPRIPKELRHGHRLTLISWRAMLGRCLYLSRPGYYENVTICERWYVFANFLEDMGDRPSINHSIDRIDPKGNYTPDNCRWITKKENSGRVDHSYSRRADVREIRRQRMKKMFEDGILGSKEIMEKVALGALKRVGRKLGKCTRCRQPAYTLKCQRCRGKRK